jgi:hypothetical protein
MVQNSFLGLATLDAFRVLILSLFPSIRLMKNSTTYCMSRYIFHVSKEKDVTKSD